MLLGLALDAWSDADVKLPLARVQLAERLGYDSVWTAEAYGADALTPLAFLAASTSRIKLATGVVQISARTPAATAMAFATLEALAGRDRVIAGLGLSGPQITLEARILHVVDAFTAMTSERPYRPAMTEQEALAELRRLRGAQFDADVVDALASVCAAAGAEPSWTVETVTKRSAGTDGSSGTARSGRTEP